MKNNKLKLNGTMLSGLIIIISFIYAINIQPKVIGDSKNQKDISKEIIDDIVTDNPVLCDYKIISDDKITDNNHRLYRCSTNNDDMRFFYLNNILNKISSCMIKINNLSDFREINSIKLG